MSGVVKGVKKVFSGVVHAVKGVVHFVAKHWVAIAIAAAVIFTAGAAMAAYGGAAAASTAAGSAAAAGTTAAAGSTAGVFGGASALSGGVTVGSATLSGVGASTVGGTILGGSTAAAGVGGLAATGSIAAGGAIDAASIFSTAAANAYPEAGALGATGTGGAYTGAIQTAADGQLGSAAASQNAWWDSSKSIFSNVTSDVTKGAKAVGNEVSKVYSATLGGEGSVGKAMLASTALKMVGGYMQAKAASAPPRNFSGRGADGGEGIGMHLLPGGVGVAAGGSTPAPTGVPNALQHGGPSNVTPGLPGATPNNTAGGILSGSSDSQTGAPANIGQTVANSAGVGGLIPQGAVNFMGS